jgi:hypothetical protein
MRGEQDMDNWKYEEENVVRMFGSDEEVGTQIPTQAQSIVEGSGTLLVSEFKPVPDVDYLQVCNYFVPKWFLFFILILFRVKFFFFFFGIQQ